MNRTNDDQVTYACDFSDISPFMRLLILLVIVMTIVSFGGCGTTMPIEQIKRQPPAADMVRLDLLPQQTDPSLGGIFKGYVNAAQKYRGCIDRLNELQDWISLAP